MMKISAEKVNQDEMKLKYRPFVNIWSACTPEFIKLAKTLFILVRYGDNDPTSQLNDGHDETFKRLLSGWKTAQNIIAKEIIIRIQCKNEIKKNKKLAHAKKDYEAKQACIRNEKRIGAEITILRRCIDSLVWSMFDNEHSSIRRLPISGNPDNLSESNILDSKLTADEINSDPLSFALITDITTFVHTGDLLALIPGKGLSLIELKSGKKNIAFSGAAEFSVLSACPHFDEAFTKNFDIKDIKHYQRAKRQIIRAKNVIDTIETGKGFDNLQQANVEILDRNFIPDYYFDKITELWREIYNGKNWAIAHINDCLYIGAYSRTDIGFCGFNSWIDGMNVKGTVYNILDSYSDPLSKPFFRLNLPDKLLLDIIDNKLIVVMCLDYKSFVEYANRKYPNLYTITEFPSSMPNTEALMSIDGKGIAKIVNKNISFLGGGIENRIIFDLHYPENLIDWDYKMSDIKRDFARVRSADLKKIRNKLKNKRKRSRRSA